MIFNEHREMVASQLRAERERMSSNVWHFSGELTVAQEASIRSMDAKIKLLGGIAEACSVNGCCSPASFDFEGSGRLFCETHYVDKRNFRIK